MATILIDPVRTKTKDGSDAEIYGIDPADTDCIHGKVNGQKHRWDKGGTCRDSSDSLNIDPREIEVKEVIDTINKISS